MSKIDSTSRTLPLHETVVNELHENKAVYTTASVAYRWAGAVVRFRQVIGKKFNSMTDQPTNRPTNRVTYRVACMQLKIFLQVKSTRAANLANWWLKLATFEGLYTLEMLSSHQPLLSSILASSVLIQPQGHFWPLLLELVLLIIWYKPSHF